MSNADGMAALMAMGIGVVLVFLLIGLVFYCLKSVGLYTLAKNRGIENPWLAWIPIADLYIMGMLVGEMDLFGMHIENLGLWVPVAVVGGSLLSMTPILGMFISIALMVFMAVFIYKLFEMYSENAILFTILSMLLGLFAVFIFVIRNNDLQVSAPVAAAATENAATTPTAEQTAVTAEPMVAESPPEEPVEADQP